MSLNDNKYRIRINSKYVRGKKRGRTRLEAIKALSELSEDEHVRGRIDFHQRTMTPEHRSALFGIAKLWRKLNDLENEVRQRPKGKRFSN